MHKKDQYWFGLKFHTRDPNLETKITVKKKINEAQLKKKSNVKR